VHCHVFSILLIEKHWKN